MKVLYALREGFDGSTCAYALLSSVFESIYGEPLPEITKTPNGKPYFPSRPNIHFSLSHSASHVLCAVSSNPVGVDIESPRQISELALRFFCSPDEAVLFDPLDLWVLKESHIKLIGGRLPLVKTIRFAMKTGVIITPDELSMSKLYHIDDCPAAISTFGRNLPDSIEHYCGSLDP